MYNKVTKDRKLLLSPKTTENTAYTQQMENVQYYLLLLYTYQVTFGKLEHTASACLLLENYLKQQSKMMQSKKIKVRCHKKTGNIPLKVCEVTTITHNKHFIWPSYAIQILKIRYCN